MRVSRAQAQENRTRVVDTASALFRERGYDGIGVVELMAAAGLSHGGFYNQFKSKAALMSEAAACGLARSSVEMADVDVGRFITHYLSRKHRDSRADGCTIAALGGDAARQDDEIKSVFQTGIVAMVDGFTERLAADGLPHTRAHVLSMVAQMVGALMLSRACPDDAPIADEILDTCRADLLAQLSGAPAK
ncbi:TetR/AcrR family transcriptional regulator [Achromobacter sp. Bel]|uniref:TetR/AcrR family transcriptional regulator n=1 Tax=Achromobacter sp. Bel TaxID=2727415 RepID=UPI00145E5454|nr:TetR/AcrR family transcriptional regulator [Achromobacter sp. Bel]NMK46997.1 TetR/AcrR family transcriptional regulator [Achromobacter sp. Bel]